MLLLNLNSQLKRARLRFGSPQRLIKSDSGRFVKMLSVSLGLRDGSLTVHRQTDYFENINLSLRRLLPPLPALVIVRGQRWMFFFLELMQITSQTVSEQKSMDVSIFYEPQMNPNRCLLF